MHIYVSIEIDLRVCLCEVELSWILKKNLFQGTLYFFYNVTHLLISDDLIIFFQEANSIESIYQDNHFSWTIFPNSF